LFGVVAPGFCINALAHKAALFTGRPWFSPEMPANNSKKFVEKFSSCRE
jgi:hypothetical protein